MSELHPEEIPPGTSFPAGMDYHIHDRLIRLETQQHQMAQDMGKLRDRSHDFSNQLQLLIASDTEAKKYRDGAALKLDGIMTTLVEVKVAQSSVLSAKTQIDEILRMRDVGKVTFWLLVKIAVGVGAIATAFAWVMQHVTLKP